MKTVEIAKLVVTHLYSNTQISEFIPRERVIYQAVIPEGMNLPVLGVLVTPLFMQGENFQSFTCEIQLRVYVTAMPSHDYTYSMFTKLSEIIETAIEGIDLSNDKVRLKNITKFIADEIATSGAPEDRQIAYIIRYRAEGQNV